MKFLESDYMHHQHGLSPKTMDESPPIVSISEVLVRIFREAYPFLWPHTRVICTKRRSHLFITAGSYGEGDHELYLSHLPAQVPTDSVESKLTFESWCRCCAWCVFADITCLIGNFCAVPSTEDFFLLVFPSTKLT